MAMTAERFTITPRLIIGLAILALGTLWTLDNLNILESEDFTQWWPVVLIAIGAVQFASRRTNRVGPVVLMIVGVLLLASSLDYIDFDLGDLIPLAIAAWGAKLVWDALARRSARAGVIGYDDATVHAFAVMGGVHWHSTTREFRGGDVNAIMGGVEIDLRDAQMKPGEEVIIDALALMGGIEIFVPAGWRIKSDVLPIMGAFENNAKASSDSGPMLTVRGTVVMGGIEVKN
jgi:predicted membrane protein